jgi:hypothetical protein
MGTSALRGSSSAGSDLGRGVSRMRRPQVTKVIPSQSRMHTCKSIRRKIIDMKLEMLSLVMRLDCLSCVLTIFSTILVGRRCWEGWVLAAANSLIICVIGLRTAQLAFIPANLFCIVLYAVYLRTWRKAEIS